MTRRALAFAAALVAAGCTVGPDYVRPAIEAPPAYKELDGWKTAQPGDELPRGAWWQVFRDPQLDELEQRAAAANQTLASAWASWAQARALVGQARAAYYPTVTLGAGAAYGRESANLSGQGTSFHNTTREYIAPLDASWEIDVWGRVRRSVESSEASAAASGDDLATVQLSIEAELAADWFQLRGDDAEVELLERSVEAYQRSLEVTRNRYRAGVAGQADVLQAQTLVDSTRAQALDVRLARALLEHAIAVLIGEPPANLSLPAQPLAATPPSVPVGVPSALLERRPDVAAAERRVASANAGIGFARAAYFPTLVLSASAGFEASDVSKWFAWASRFWSVGPSVSETVFDGGLRGAQTDQARAAYDQTVADYRQSALTAFQETEDALSQLGLLAREAGAQDAALRAATESVRIATNQYKAGTISELDVVVVQTGELNSARADVELASRRMVAAVGLIKALGGSWQP